MPSGKQIPPKIIDYIIDAARLAPNLSGKSIALMVVGEFGYEMDQSAVLDHLRKNGLDAETRRRMVSERTTRGPISGTEPGTQAYDSAFEGHGQQIKQVLAHIQGIEPLSLHDRDILNF